MQKKISEARLEANRANGALSKGPKTAAGKARSSQNALKHGLRSEKSPLIPTDISQDSALPGEHQEFQLTLATFTADFAPATLMETRLVERLAQLDHRLRRAARIETALFHRHIEKALADEPRIVRNSPRPLDVYVSHEDPLPDAPERTQSNWLLGSAFERASSELTLLSYYEARLSRDFHRTLAQLRQTQRLRKPAEPNPCLASDGQVAPPPESAMAASDPEKWANEPNSPPNNSIDNDLTGPGAPLFQPPQAATNGNGNVPTGPAKP